MPLSDRVVTFVHRLTAAARAGWERGQPRRPVQKSAGDRAWSKLLGGGLGYSWPGGWSSDRIEQSMHFRHWIYLGIRAIYERIAELPPQIGLVTVDQAPESGRPRHESLSRQLLLQARYQKTQQAIQPHESVEMVGHDHPLVRLLARPNSQDVAWDLWSELILFLRLMGNSFLWVVPNRLGLPQELWVIPAHWVYPKIRSRAEGDEGLIEYFEIRPFVGQSNVRLPAEEVLWFKYKSALHKLDGWSPLMAGSEWIDAGESVDRSRFWAFKNGCFPIGAIELGNKYEGIDDFDLDRLYAKFFARMQGESKYGLPLIMPPDAKYNPLMIAPAEMAYVESAAQLQEWCLSIQGVPKELVGLQPVGSDLSWYAPQLMFAKQTISPLVQYLGQVLTARLASRYDERLRIWWNDPTPNNPTQVNADIAQDIAGRAISVNEIRAIRGREPWPGGDDPVAGAGESILPLATGEAVSDYLPTAEQIQADREQEQQQGGGGSVEGGGNGQPANGQNGNGNGEPAFDDMLASMPVNRLRDYGNGNRRKKPKAKRALAVAKCGGEGGKPGPCPQGVSEEPAHDRPAKTPKEARHKLASIGKMSWDALKQAGMKAEHAEHAMAAWGADKVGTSLAKLPPTMQKAVRGTWIVARAGTREAFTSWIAGQAAVEKVARLRGATPENARRMRGICAAVDAFTCKPVTIGLELSGQTGLAMAASMVPLGSMSYLAYASAGEAVNRIKFAGRVAKIAYRKIRTGKEAAVHADLEKTLTAVLDGMSNAKDADWYTALVMAAFDKTGDIRIAVKVAELALKENPAGPDQKSNARGKSTKCGGEGSGRPGPCPGPGHEESGRESSGPVPPDKLSSWTQEHFGHWAAGLAPKETAALKTYQKSSETINTKLRDGGSTLLMRGTLKAVDSAIAKGEIPHDVTVFRGINSKKMMLELKEGAEFHDRGFISTSMSEDLATNFGSYAVVQIRVPKGTHAASMEAMANHTNGPGASEHELLLPRGTGFKITAVQDHPSGRKVMTAELVGGDSSKAGEFTHGR